MNQAPTPSDSRLAYLVRVSTDDQEREATPETQLMGCREKAAKLGFDSKSARVYPDAWRGTEYFERPELSKLRQAITRGEIDTVITYDGDRIARDPVFRLMFIRESEHYGCAVHYAVRDIDRSDAGELVEYAGGYGSKDEVFKIRQRSIRGAQRRASEGKRLPGCNPKYGYSWDDDRPKAKGALTIDPLSGAVVRRIFAEYAAGRSLRMIARGLDTDGIPTPSQYAKSNRRTCGKWSPGTIREIVGDIEYTGRSATLRHSLALKKGKKSPGVIDRPPEEWIALPEGTTPALVDWATFSTAQERIAHNRQESTRRHRDPSACLLRTSFGQCGYCGRTLITRWAGQQGYIYECSHGNRRRWDCPHYTIQANILDGFVWDKVAGILNDPSQIEREIDLLMRSDSDPTDIDIAAVDARMRTIERDSEKMRRRLTSEDDDRIAALYRDDLRKLLDEQDQLTAERTAILARREAWQDARKRAEHLFAYIRRSESAVADFTYQQKRDALAWLGVKARVKKMGDEPRIDVRATLRLTSITGGLGETLPTDVGIDDYRKWQGVVGDLIGPYERGTRFTVSDTARPSGRFWKEVCRSMGRISSKSGFTAS